MGLARLASPAAGRAPLRSHRPTEGAHPEHERNLNITAVSGRRLGGASRRGTCWSRETLFLKGWIIIIHCMQLHPDNN